MGIVSLLCPGKRTPKERLERKIERAVKKVTRILSRYDLPPKIYEERGSSATHSALYEAYKEGRLAWTKLVEVIEITSQIDFMRAILRGYS